MKGRAPLYKGVEHPKKYLQGHKGLWFERFFQQYYYDENNPQDDKNWTLNEKNQHPDDQNTESTKYAWINTVAGGQCGSNEALKHHALQQLHLGENLQAEYFVAKNTWNFAVGMGNNHPVENGFSWHPSLGVPYLTGAAVKGLLRTWIEQWSDLNPEKRHEKCQRWFGSEEKDPEYLSKNSDAKAYQTGSVIFFDALPICPVTLSCDIMTPHRGKWYSQGDDINAENRIDTLPADWHNPTPIPFLVVQEIYLHISIAPRPCAEPILKEELLELLNDVQMALEFLGAGAKTATGYGRFEVNRQHRRLLQQWREQYVQQQQLDQIAIQRSKMSLEDVFRDQLIHPHCAYSEQEIAELFGKNFNKTQQYYVDKSVQWDSIITILLEEKIALIQSWQTAAKNTQQAKSYKKLAPYLPQLWIYLAQDEHVHYRQVVNHKEQEAETQDFAVIYYQNQALKPVNISIIGTDNSAWYAFLSTWYQQLLQINIDDIETLADEILEVMAAEEDSNSTVQQSSLDTLSQDLGDRIQCTLALLKKA